MSAVSAQVSVYPLRRLSVGAPIEACVAAMRRHDVEVGPSPMSTVVVGPEVEVFRALEAGYRAACEGGEAVMVATISNACPLPEFGDALSPEAPASPARRSSEEE